MALIKAHGSKKKELQIREPGEKNGKERATKADNTTLCLWTLIKDVIDEENSQASDSTQGELEESQEGSLPERTFSEKGPLNPKLERYRDTTDELTLEEKAHSDEGAAKYYGEDWPPSAPSAPPMVFTVQDDTQMDMQLHKLEFEIKLQKLTNELQELKRVSSAGRSSGPEMHQSPLEKSC